MWIEPIVDRTAKDAELGNAKGCCNAADLNRLEGNIAVIAGLLELTTVPRLRPWTTSDLPTEAEMRRTAGNIALLRRGYACYRTTPPAPEHPLNSWDRWNAAEQILQDIRLLYDDRRAARQFCGEKLSGERIGLL